MKYQTFDCKDEQKINDFLAKNRELIGKDSYWSDPKGGKLHFLFNDEFDPQLARRIHQRISWQETLKKKCTELADMKLKEKLWELNKPEDKVGEKDASGTIGGMKGVVSVSAKEALELNKKDIEEWEKQIEVLEDLLNGNDKTEKGS